MGEIPMTFIFSSPDTRYGSSYACLVDSNGDTYSYNDGYNGVTRFYGIWCDWTIKFHSKTPVVKIAGLAWYLLGLAGRPGW